MVANTSTLKFKVLATAAEYKAQAREAEYLHYSLLIRFLKPSREESMQNFA